MAFSKLLMASIAAAIVIYGVGADSGIEELRSRLSALESSITDRIQDIKKKDQSILNFENAINEKSASIFSLQSKIELLRKQASADAEKSMEKVNKQASEMEKQVARLKSEIEAQTMKRGALEARGIEAEKKLQELNLKLERLHENHDKQKLRIKITERDLQVAEEELMKAQLEAASKLKKLTEVKVTVHENLKKHDLTKRFATRELSWFLASAILGFPMFFLVRLLSAIFCKKTICGQNANRNQTPSNQKRKHGGK